MLGHLMEWIYSGLAGIRPAVGAIAFNKIEIRPEPVGDVTYVKANYQSPYGNIASNWKKSKDSFELNVVIPPNTTGMVYLPVSKTAGLRVNGQPVSARKDIKSSGYQNGKMKLAIGSGTYSFVAK